MLFERTEEIVEYTHGSFGSVPLTLACWRHREANLHLAWIVGAKMSSKIPDEASRFLATNCELEPSTGGVEDACLKAADELFDVSKRAGLKVLVATDSWIRTVLQHGRRVAQD